MYPILCIKWFVHLLVTDPIKKVRRYFGWTWCEARSKAVNEKWGRYSKKC